MSGESKAKEVFYQLTLKRGFETRVKEARKKLNIPPDGFNSLSDGDTWMKEMEDPRRLLEFYLIQEKILSDFRTLNTPTIKNLLEDYIYSNGRFPVFRRIEKTGTSSAYGVPSVEKMKEVGQTFVELRIYDTASQDEVVKYVRDNWSTFKRIFGVGNLALKKPTQRVRTTKLKDRNKRIVELARLPLRELREMAQDSTRKLYKEIAIAQILEKEGFETPTFEAVKKVVQRSSRDI